jgi:hypothetical protein
MWIQTLLNELQVHNPSTTRIWCDNIGATYLATNLVFHGRTKHVEVDFHFVRERVANKLLDVRLISKHDQIANGFTKLVTTFFQKKQEGVSLLCFIKINEVKYKLSRI